MDEKYKMVLNEANVLGLDITSCRSGDTECLETLINKYTEALNKANDLDLDITSCRSSDQNLIDDSIIIDR